MPSKRSPYSRGRRSLRGRGKVWDWIKGAAKTVGNFAKKHQLVSKGLGWLQKSGIVSNPLLSSAVGLASKGASMAGYGRRMGRGVRLAGGALRLAGARRY